MPCLKIVPGPYQNGDALERLIYGYVFPKAKLYGGLAVDPACAAEQMHLVKDAWQQTSGRQLHHFILSFSEDESDRIYNESQLSLLAYHICQYFAGEYQIVFGVHKSRNWHIHFVVNTVNYITGKRLHQKRENDYDLKYHIISLLQCGHIEVYYY